MKLSKAYKAEHYDEIEAERSKYVLALHDLANGKFSAEKRLAEKDYQKGEKGSLAMRVSLRAMPLFLVEWSTPANEHKSMTVYTESELEDIARDAAYGCFTNRMLTELFYSLKREHYPKVA